MAELGLIAAIISVIGSLIALGAALIGRRQTIRHVHEYEQPSPSEVDSPAPQPKQHFKRLKHLRDALISVVYASTAVALAVGCVVAYEEWFDGSDAAELTFGIFAIGLSIMAIVGVVGVVYHGLGCIKGFEYKGNLLDRFLQ